VALDKRLLGILACPKCKGSLTHKKSKEEEGLSCIKCKLSYRVEDDIPVLLVEKAEKLQ